MLNTRKEFFCHIAHSILRFYVSPKQAFQLLIPSNYKAFVSTTASKPEIEIAVCNPVPAIKSTAKLIFDATQTDTTSHENQATYWRVYKEDSNYLIAVFDSPEACHTRMLAQIPQHSTQWHIYTEATGTALSPLTYPMDVLLWHYLLMPRKGFMMHASAVIDDDRGYLFSGFSGIGKTTIARLCQQEGAALINDDRIALRYTDGAFRLYNTPMPHYCDKPKQQLLSAVFLLQQSPNNYLKPLKGAVALARVMAFCIQHDHEPQAVNYLLNSLTELIRTIPIYELGFRPDSDVIKMIRDVVR